MYKNVGVFIVSIFFVYFLLPSHINAATFYTATNGSDSNSGTQSSPFRTINKGVGILKAGDTLLVQPGTYNESFTSSFPSGTSWSSPVTVKAANSTNRPIIKPSSATFVFYFNSGQKYIIIDGFVMDGENVEHDTLKVTETANHIRIMNGEVRNSPKQGILISGSGTDYNEFINLYVHDNGTRTAYDHGIYLSTSNNLVDGNIFANNAAYGIHLWNSDSSTAVNNNIVRNNIVYGHKSGKSGIIISRGTGNVAYNNIVYNNSNGISINYNAKNTKILNNTVYNNDGFGINVGSDSSASIVNNIIYSNGSTIGGSATNSNNLTSDPKFVNASGGDFHLTSSSPAINKGSTLTEVKTDYEGGVRPNGSGYDIGADEYGTSTGGPGITGQPSSTNAPNNIPSLNPTNPTGSANFIFTLKLHGIGLGGDNANPQSLGNFQLLHPQRTITAELFNSSNQLMGTKQISVNFGQSSGVFTGSDNFGNLSSGGYTLKIKANQYLSKQYPGIIVVNSGQQVTLPVISLVTGDSNNDNTLSVLDYNQILDCYADLSQPKNCSDAIRKQMADITDDGNVNQFDYNLFLRELSIQSGE